MDMKKDCTAREAGTYLAFALQNLKNVMVLTLVPGEHRERCIDKWQSLSVALDNTIGETLETFHPEGEGPI